MSKTQKKIAGKGLSLAIAALLATQTAGCAAVSTEVLEKAAVHFTGGAALAGNQIQKILAGNQIQKMGPYGKDALDRAVVDRDRALLIKASKEAKLGSNRKLAAEYLAKLDLSLSKGVVATALKHKKVDILRQACDGSVVFKGTSLKIEKREQEEACKSVAHHEFDVALQTLPCGEVPDLVKSQKELDDAQYENAALRLADCSQYAFIFDTLLEARPAQRILQALHDGGYPVEQELARAARSTGGHAPSPLFSVLVAKHLKANRFLEDCEAFKPGLRAEANAIGVAYHSYLGAVGCQAAVEAISANLANRSWEVRRAATVALGELSAKQKALDVVPLLSDDDPDVRKAACWTLGKLEDPSTAQKVKLVSENDPTSTQKALEDPIYPVRNACAQAYQRIMINN